VCVRVCDIHEDVSLLVNLHGDMTHGQMCDVTCVHMCDVTCVHMSDIKRVQCVN